MMVIVGCSHVGSWHHVLVFIKSIFVPSHSRHPPMQKQTCLCAKEKMNGQLVFNPPSPRKARNHTVLPQAEVDDDPCKKLSNQRERYARISGSISFMFGCNGRIRVSPVVSRAYKRRNGIRSDPNSTRILSTQVHLQIVHRSWPFTNHCPEQ
ncbi:hypothetical protein BR93DRAFT_571610 [Coniochaeta sp. PMI_546]|nr:hypothetical protein BR93DRAFT_571610 [Coniochaeta sp. PMI_546]